MYDIKIIQKVLQDFKSGKNKSQLSREYNIPRPTLRYWIKKDTNGESMTQRKSDIPIEYIIEKIKKNKEMYNYILGIYLGDGHISPNKNSYKLRIVMDSKYPNLVHETRICLRNFFESPVSVNSREGCKVISVFDKNLPKYFPQHGFGKKHDRKIILSDFQIENISYSDLLKGLWLTDGSYYLRKNKYEAYNFTNKSIDIVSIFEKCLNSLSISYRKRVKNDGIWVIEVAKKSEVNKMKSIVELKS